MEPVKVGGGSAWGWGTLLCAHSPGTQSPYCHPLGGDARSLPTPLLAEPDLLARLASPAYATEGCSCLAAPAPGSVQAPDGVTWRLELSGIVWAACSFLCALPALPLPECRLRGSRTLVCPVRGRGPRSGPA